VQLTSSINSLTHKVLIWLGPGSPGFDPVFECVRTRNIPSCFEERSEGLWLVRCLTILCNNPLFGRVWILQEMLLTRYDPCICVGSAVMLWSVLYDFVLAVLEQIQVFATQAAADGDKIQSHSQRPTIVYSQLQRVSCVCWTCFVVAERLPQSLNRSAERNSRRQQLLQTKSTNCSVFVNLTNTT
jgi:hypothetical protein